MMKSLAVMAAITLFIPRIAQARSDPQSPWSLSIQGSYLYGDVRGSLQTPSGGEPATTSPNRPTLSEIGIHSESLYDARLDLAYNNEGFVAIARFAQFSGSATLDDTLISQAENFPAGTHVSSDVQLNWYEFMYRHRFAFFNDDAGRPQFAVDPAVGVALFDFSYKLHSAAARVDRSYLKLTPQLALDADWYPPILDHHFWLDLHLEASCAPSPLPQLFVEELTENYRLLDISGATFDVFAGVQFDQMNYKDNQSTPNHIRADFGPLGIAGLRLNF